jgi:hypothetical protein
MFGARGPNFVFKISPPHEMKKAVVVGGRKYIFLLLYFILGVCLVNYGTWRTQTGASVATIIWPNDAMNGWHIN